MIATTISSQFRQSATVSSIVEASLGVSPTSIKLVEDQGNVNSAFDVNTKKGDFIVRSRFGSTEMHQFIREKNCADLIRQTHDWTPEIVDIGLFENNAYSVQRKVPGVMASKLQDDLTHVWEQIGSYAEFFHSIEVSGYLRNAFRVSTSGELPWCKAYFDQLGEASNAKLVSEGLLTAEEFALGLISLKPLETLDFKPTLAHGNISLNNIIVDPNGKAHLIDWGSCVGHMAIDLDLSELLLFDVPAHHVDAYLYGHSLPSDYVKHNSEILERLKLARCFTNAHWLCESDSHRNGDLLRYVEKTRHSLQMLTE